MMAKFSPGTSLLHRLSPLSKLAVLVAFCITIFSFDSVAFGVAALLAILMIAAVTRVRPVFSLVGSKFILPMILMIVVMQALFTPAGTVYLVVPLHFFTVVITDLGILKGIIMALRFLTVILASCLFVATTDPATLAYALMLAGVPYRYGFMVITMLRFAPVFELEFNAVGNAQKMRGLEIDKGGVRLLIKSIRYTFVPLIVSALSKVDALTISMEGRAFGHRRVRTFTKGVRYTNLDKALILFSLLFVILLFVDSLTGWYPLPHLGV